jgi:hypothetical protein
MEAICRTPTPRDDVLAYIHTSDLNSAHELLDSHFPQYLGVPDTCTPETLARDACHHLGPGSVFSSPCVPVQRGAVPPSSPSSVHSMLRNSG